MLLFGSSDPVFWHFVGPKGMISLKAENVDRAEAKYQMQQRMSSR